MPSVSAPRTLHRLIYVSRSNVPEADLDHELGEIIRASIRNNREVAITGLLLSHENWFMQALEGPAERVMTTYRRILDDPRHGAAQVLSAGPVDEREFADWNMCARRMSDADEAILGTLAQRGRIDPTRLGAADVLRLLRAVRGIQDRLQRRA